MPCLLRLLLKRDLFLSEEFFYHFIPGVFQSLIHRKRFKGTSGHTGERFSVKADIKIESLYFVRIQRKIVLLDEPGNISV